MDNKETQNNNNVIENNSEAVTTPVLNAESVVDQSTSDVIIPSSLNIDSEDKELQLYETQILAQLEEAQKAKKKGMSIKSKMVVRVFSLSLVAILLLSSFILMFKAIDEDRNKTTFSPNKDNSVKEELDGGNEEPVLEVQPPNDSALILEDIANILKEAPIIKTYINDYEVAISSDDASINIKIFNEVFEYGEATFEFVDNNLVYTFDVDYSENGINNYLFSLTMIEDLIYAVGVYYDYSNTDVQIIIDDFKNNDKYMSYYNNLLFEYGDEFTMDWTFDKRKITILNKFSINLIDGFAYLESIN